MSCRRGYGSAVSPSSAHVRPEDLVPRLREVLRAAVHVQAVGERVPERAHVPAGVAGRLEHGHVVAALHELVGAGQPGDAPAGDDDPLRPAGRRPHGLPVRPRRRPGPWRTPSASRRPPRRRTRRSSALRGGSRVSVPAPCSSPRLSGSRARTRIRPARDSPDRPGHERAGESRPGRRRADPARSGCQNSMRAAELDDAWRGDAPVPQAEVGARDVGVEGALPQVGSTPPFQLCQFQTLKASNRSCRFTSPKIFVFLMSERSWLR